MKTIGTVIATYNGEKYVEEQIDSILNQSLRPHKIIVVDDCSTDKTAGIVARYRGAHPEIIIFEQNEKNMGYVKTFEHGISVCQTDYIAISDQDDIWKPDKIEKCYHTLEQNKEAKLCFHDLEFIDGNGNPLGKNFWDSALIPLPMSGTEARKRLANLINGVPGCTMFFSSDLKEYLLPMPDSKWSGHDWWIAVVGFFLANPIIVNEVLTCYRIHENQTCALAVNIKRKKKRRSFKDILFRIKRETKRIMLRRRITKIRSVEKKEREHALSQDVLKAITMYETFNLSHIPKEELFNLKDILKSNTRDMD